ncbi:MAG: hypothetical protein P8Y79_07170 [Ignavibacteriaceae bacterium]|jgi:hypothetical protein
MDIPLIDRSNYLRGLLVLAKKDNQVSEHEKKIILDAGKKLGFSSSFCEEILNTILHNDCVCHEPIKFDNYTVAKSFIIDGIKLSLSGKDITNDELQWLRKSAEKNNISKKWVDKQVANFEYITSNPSITQLTLYSII